MMPFIAPDLMPAFPEIVLAAMAMLLVVMGVTTREGDHNRVSHFSLFVLIVVGTAVFGKFMHEEAVTFNGMFIADGFASLMKILVIAGSVFSLLMASGYARRQRIMRVEYPILVVFSTLGMMLMISANDLIALYMGLELQSLPLYVLAALQRDGVRSTEAGLKYFVLGAISSGILLYGASLLYGYTGTTGFGSMADAIRVQGDIAPGIVVGMVLLISGLAFKISAVPFHMWAPDVYEGAPTSVTAFFAIAPKMAALALIARVLTGPFGGMVAEWQQIIVVLSMGSMALGAVAAIAQTNIKRMLAYSSIGHMGYVLMGLAAGDALGIKAVIVYAVIYMVTSIGAFSVVLMMKQRDRMVEEISDLAGLGERRPLMALAMTAIMFSMAGIPPLAGFFGKLFVFQAAIDAQLYALAIVGVLTSVIAAYYYLRIIKVMYFDSGLEEGIDPAVDGRLNFALTVAFAAIVAFIAVPAPLLNAAEAATQSLFYK